MITVTPRKGLINMPVHPEMKESVFVSKTSLERIEGKYLEIENFIRAEVFAFRKFNVDPTRNYCWCAKGGSYFPGCTGTFDKDEILVKIFYIVKGGTRIETWKYNCFILAFDSSIDIWSKEIKNTLSVEKQNIELIDAKRFNVPAYIHTTDTMSDADRRAAMRRYNVYKRRYEDATPGSLIQFKHYNALLLIYYELSNAGVAPNDWGAYLEKHKNINSKENVERLGVEIPTQK